MFVYAHHPITKDGLRKYDAPDVVWDEQDGCQHNWEGGIVKGRHKAGETNPGKEAWYKDKGAAPCQHDWDITTIVKSDAAVKPGPNSCAPLQETTEPKEWEHATCKKCGAWRGALGLEPTIELFTSHLIQIFDEVRRVLKPTGTCWVVLGDTYASHAANSKNVGGFQGKQIKANPKYAESIIVPPKRGIPDKSLCLIPQRFAIAMVEQGWVLRNWLIWHKLNCIPQSVTDRFTVDYENILFFSRQPHYFFTQQFEPILNPDKRGHQRIVYKGKGHPPERMFSGGATYLGQNNEQGRNARAVWNIKTRPSGEKHFAVFPPELVQRILKAAAPEFVCVKCGKPREKIIESHNKNKSNEAGIKEMIAKGVPRTTANLYTTKRTPTLKQIIGLTDCRCDAGFVAGIVLDPFLGMGTTALVAKQMGFNYIGIELSETYTKIAERLLEKTTRQPELTFGEK